MVIQGDTDAVSTMSPLGRISTCSRDFQYAMSLDGCTTLDIHNSFMALSQPALTLKSRPDFSAG
ncbi:hypothetical protein [Kistimonas asteriae]|uniref:hypothetical protein n=1 Tax=Kistimonas asteriae TaxID=517724 RepID=UPI001BA4A497|nr:hypothetical protein [Kistimonas asteriae]